MTTSRSLLAMAAAATLIMGCSDSGSSGVDTGPDGNAAPMSFVAFVEETMANDGVEPMGFNEREITFDSQEDETAFDEHLKP